MFKEHCKTIKFNRKILLNIHNFQCKKSYIATLRAERAENL